MKVNTRRLARALLPIAVAAAVTAAAPTAASPSEIETLRARAQELADEVSALEHRLADLGARRSRLEDRLGHADREMALLEIERREAAGAYEAALDDYVERAVDVYKGPSPGMTLELILQARSLSDMALLNHVTGSTADAAAASLAELRIARDQAIALQEKGDIYKQELITAAAELDEVSGQVSSTLDDRHAALKKMNAKIAELEAEARRAARSASQPSAALQNLLDGSGPSHGIPDGFAGTGVSFEGVASWYGPGFEGNLTANGDVFDPEEFTAASKELPLGSWLYVEHHGAGVVVYVNDRGPYVDGRILDLSQAAAEEIGITGLGWIEAEVVIKL